MTGKDLIAKYPDLFELRHDQLECSDGWCDIIERFIIEMTDMLRTHSMPSDKYPKFYCLKEKFGGLRIHLDNTPVKFRKEIHDLIIKYESLSFSICELCGSKGELMMNQNRWDRTLCDSCAAQDSKNTWEILECEPEDAE